MRLTRPSLSVGSERWLNGVFMQVAIITYTVTPCPSCGVNMSGYGTVTRNGSDLWTGLIDCDHCGYAVSGEGNSEFYAASATANKHRTAVKRSGWSRCNV